MTKKHRANDKQNTSGWIDGWKDTVECSNIVMKTALLKLI